MAINAEKHSYFKFARQVFTMGLLNLFSAVQSLVFLPVITKILGAEDYGIWSQIKITTGLLVTFALLGMHESLTRFLPAAKDKKTMQEEIYSSLVFVSVITLAIAIILTIFAGPVSLFFRFDSIFIRLLALIIIFESLTTMLLVSVQAMREIGKYFWFTIIKMFGEAGLAIGAILLGYGLHGAVLSLLAIRIIIFLILFIFIFKRIGIKIPDFSIIKDYLRFGLPTVFNNVSYSIVTSADRYLIGFFLGIVFVGYYAPAYSIAMILSFFLFPIASMLSVVLPKLFDENDVAKVKTYLSYSLKYFLLAIIPAVFGMSFLARNLLLIFSTEEIAAKSYLVIPFIATSMLFYGVSYFFTQILVLAKKTKLIAKIWMTGAFLNIAINIILIPLFGILAAATVTLISYLAAFILLWFFSSKELTFEIEWGFVAKSIISSLLMVLAISLFNPDKLFNVILLIIFGVLVYGILISLFKGIGKKEFIFLKNLIKGVEYES